MGDGDEMGSLFDNSIILMPKNSYVKTVFVARSPSSMTDLSNYYWLLESVQMIMTGVNGKFFSVTDLSCAYHEVPLNPKSQKLTGILNFVKNSIFTHVESMVCADFQIPSAV